MSSALSTTTNNPGHPPQLHLSIAPTTTSFKRSFEEFGFDLDDSPVAGGSHAFATDGGDPGNDSNLSGSGGERNERNKRARSASSLSDTSDRASSSSSSSSRGLATMSSSDTSLNANSNSHYSYPSSSTSQSTTGLAASSSSNPLSLALGDNVQFLRHSTLPPRLSTPDIIGVDVDIDMLAPTASSAAASEPPLPSPMATAAPPPSSSSLPLSFSLSLPIAALVPLRSNLNLDIDLGHDSGVITEITETPSLPTQLEQFNTFDSQIEALRRTPPSPGPSYSSNFAPSLPTLPPLDLDLDHDERPRRTPSDRPRPIHHRRTSSSNSSGTLSSLSSSSRRPSQDLTLSTRRSSVSPPRNSSEQQARGSRPPVYLDVPPALFDPLFRGLDIEGSSVSSSPRSSLEEDRESPPTYASTSQPPVLPPITAETTVIWDAGEGSSPGSPAHPIVLSTAGPARNAAQTQDVGVELDLNVLRNHVPPSPSLSDLRRWIDNGVGSGESGPNEVSTAPSRSPVPIGPWEGISSTGPGTSSMANASSSQSPSVPAEWWTSRRTSGSESTPDPSMGDGFSARAAAREPPHGYLRITEEGRNRAGQAPFLPPWSESWGRLSRDVGFASWFTPASNAVSGSSGGTHQHRSQRDRLFGEVATLDESSSNAPISGRRPELAEVQNARVQEPTYASDISPLARSWAALAAPDASIYPHEPVETLATGAIGRWIDEPSTGINRRMSTFLEYPQARPELSLYRPMRSGDLPTRTMPTTREDPSQGWTRGAPATGTSTFSTNTQATTAPNVTTRTTEPASTGSWSASNRSSHSIFRSSTSLIAENRSERWRRRDEDDLRSLRNGLEANSNGTGARSLSTLDANAHRNQQDQGQNEPSSHETNVRRQIGERGEVQMDEFWRMMAQFENEGHPLAIMERTAHDGSRRDRDGIRGRPPLREATPDDLHPPSADVDMESESDEWSDDSDSILRALGLRVRERERRARARVSQGDAQFLAQTRAAAQTFAHPPTSLPSSSNLNSLRRYIDIEMGSDDDLSIGREQHRQAQRASTTTTARTGGEEATVTGFPYLSLPDISQPQFTPLGPLGNDISGGNGPSNALRNLSHSRQTRQRRSVDHSTIASNASASHSTTSRLRTLSMLEDDQAPRSFPDALRQVYRERGRHTSEGSLSRALLGYGASGGSAHVPVLPSEAGRTRNTSGESTLPASSLDAELGADGTGSSSGSRATRPSHLARTTFPENAPRWHLDVSHSGITRAPAGPEGNSRTATTHAAFDEAYRSFAASASRHAPQTAAPPPAPGGQRLSEMFTPGPYQNTFRLLEAERLRRTQGASRLSQPTSENRYPMPPQTTSSMDPQPQNGPPPHRRRGSPSSQSRPAIDRRWFDIIPQIDERISAEIFPRFPMPERPISDRPTRPLPSNPPSTFASLSNPDGGAGRPPPRQSQAQSRHYHPPHQSSSSVDQINPFDSMNRDLRELRDLISQAAHRPPFTPSDPVMTINAAQPNMNINTLQGRIDDATQRVEEAIRRADSLEGRVQQVVASRRERLANLSASSSAPDSSDRDLAWGSRTTHGSSSNLASSFVNSDTAELRRMYLTRFSERDRAGPAQNSSTATPGSNAESSRMRVGMRIRPRGLGDLRRRLNGFAMGDFMTDDDFDDSYENLLDLTEGLGDVVPRHTPASVLKSLESSVYKDWANTDSDKRCPICLDDYSDEDPVMKLNSCSHWMHKECLTKWLGGASTCPVCRNSVNQSSSSRPSVSAYLSSRLSTHAASTANRQATQGRPASYRLEISLPGEPSRTPAASTNVPASRPNPYVGMRLRHPRINGGRVVSAANAGADAAPSSNPPRPPAPPSGPSAGDDGAPMAFR